MLILFFFDIALGYSEFRTSRSLLLRVTRQVKNELSNFERKLFEFQLTRDLHENFENNSKVKYNMGWISDADQPTCFILENGGSDRRVR